MTHNHPVSADYYAISAGSPPLIPMLWSMRLVLGPLLWGKMGP